MKTSTVNTYTQFLKYDLKSNFIKEWEGVKIAAKTFRI